MTGAVSRKSFGSDNHAGAHPAVMRAIVEANAGDAIPYGGDPWTAQAVDEIQRRSGAQGGVYLVLNGSGANVLGLGLLLDRHAAVICAESAHINTDECGAAERVLGTKLLTVPAPNGKITPELIASRLAGRGDEHFAQPGVVAITQSTDVLSRRRILGRAVQLRSPYVDALSLLQLRALRGLRTGDAVEHVDDLRRLLLLTVNGVAAGLQNTG